MVFFFSLSFLLRIRLVSLFGSHTHTQHTSAVDKQQLLRMQHSIANGSFMIWHLSFKSSIFVHKLTPTVAELVLKAFATPKYFVCLFLSVSNICMFSCISLSHAITIFNWIYATQFRQHSMEQQRFWNSFVFDITGSVLCADKSDLRCYSDHIYTFNVDNFHHNFLIMWIFSLEKCAYFFLRIVANLRKHCNASKCVDWHDKVKNCWWILKSIAGASLKTRADTKNQLSWLSKWAFILHVFAVERRWIVWN